MKKVLALAVFLALGVFSPQVFSAPSSSAGASSDKTKEILENQKEILKQLDEIKKELEVIKIRATR